MRILIKVFMTFCLIGLFLIKFEIAIATTFTGSYTENLYFPEGSSFQYKSLTLNGYDASKYVIDDFTFSANFSNTNTAGDGLNIWIKLPTGDWQWMDDMVNMPQGSSVNLSFGDTYDWQLERLNEALGENGVLNMQLQGYGGGGFYLKKLTLTIAASKVPEPATILLLGLGLSVLGLVGMSCKVKRCHK
jgi:hypothetical protein